MVKIKLADEGKIPEEIMQLQATSEQPMQEVQSVDEQLQAGQPEPQIEVTDNPEEATERENTGEFEGLQIIYYAKSEPKFIKGVKVLVLYDFTSKPVLLLKKIEE
jgi:hypothetical protein